MMDRKKQRNVRGALRGVVALLLCLTLLAGGAFAKTVRGDLSDRFEEPPTLEKDGQTYQYRRGLETILFMGIDTFCCWSSTRRTRPSRPSTSTAM